MSLPELGAASRGTRRVSQERRLPALPALLTTLMESPYASRILPALILTTLVYLKSPLYSSIYDKMARIKRPLIFLSSTMEHVLQGIFSGVARALIRRTALPVCP